MLNNTTKKIFRQIILEGEASDVGKQQAELIKDYPQIVQFFAAKRKLISSKDLKEITNLYEEYCPSLLEEIIGFAEILNVPIENLRYLNYTWLKPRCSQFGILTSKSEEGKVFLARNYDFSYRLDDMRLCKTAVKNNYSHLGFSTVFFGRIDGINERGLAITMSSAGLPVGYFPSMKSSRIKGLQFWAVIRIILDKCRNVEEAINLVESIPMAYNANFLVADKSNSIALIETYDGKIAHKLINSSTKENYICATNHVVLPELKNYDPLKMQNSKVRFDTIESSLNNTPLTSKEGIKQILSNKYPKGLCCHYYTEFFGTMNSVIYNPIDMEIEICFGPADVNDWHSKNFDINGNSEYEVVFPKEKAPNGFWSLE